MRSNEQNDCLHKWCRVIRDHINEDRQQKIQEAARSNNLAMLEFWKTCPKVTEETVKELVLLKMGNTREVMGEKVAMRSRRYKRTEAELTPEERKAGFISMNELLGLMEVWAAMDLGLNLQRDEECAA